MSITRASITLLSFVFCLSCKQKEAQKDSSEAIRQLIERANVSGLSVSIIDSEGIVDLETYGVADAYSKEDISKNHAFVAASLSKSVFAYLIGELAEDGLFDLDTPLVEYLSQDLPDFDIENSRKSFSDLRGDDRYKQLTARMCLSHTTGFPNWRWMTREYDDLPDGKLRFIIDPDTRFFYSGEGYNLLQFVVEQKIGESLESLAQRYVFGPLDMHHTSFEWLPIYEKILVKGHDRSGQPHHQDIRMSANAAGSLKTTIEDYSRFLSHVMRLSQSGDPLIKNLLTPQVKITGQTQTGYHTWVDTDDNRGINLGYGLGWALIDTPFGQGAFKEGHDRGYQHYTIIYPEEDIGVILMSNSDNAESIYKELLQLTIGDLYTPYQWLRYTPYNQNK